MGGFSGAWKVVSMGGWGPSWQIGSHKFWHEMRESLSSGRIPLPWLLWHLYSPHSFCSFCSFNYHASFVLYEFVDAHHELLLKSPSVSVSASVSVSVSVCSCPNVRAGAAVCVTGPHCGANTPSESTFSTS